MITTPWYLAAKIPDIIKFWFKIAEDECVESSKKIGFKCKVCANVLRIVTLGNGWTNAMSHLKDKHPDYEKVMKDCDNDQSKLEHYFCTKTKTVFGWLELITSLNLPIDFITKKVARKYIRLNKISRNSFMKYAQKVTELTERKIAAILPKKFGIVFDGWTENGKHFVALFARFLNEDDEVEEILLTCSPLDDESDLGAESHAQFIMDTLELYGKNKEDILFICGDNASTNQAIANILAKPFIGCYSHKFNLAMQKLFIVYEEYIESIAEAMKMLKGVKRAAILEEKGAKKLPLLRNKTRWSSTFKMIKRYFELLPYMDISDQELMACIPISHNDELKAFCDKLSNLNEVTVALQAQDLTLLEAKQYFQETLAMYPNEGFQEYLGNDSHLIKNKVFESAVIKVLNQQEEQLSLEEKEALKEFELDDDCIIVQPAEVDDSRRHSIVSKVKKQKLMKKSSYINLKLICPTSNCCERFFSLCGIIWSKLRRRLLPKNLEMLLFLKLNEKFWDLNLVKAAIAECGSEEDEAEVNDSEFENPDSEEEEED
jgi:hypothetical protein